MFDYKWHKAKKTPKNDDDYLLIDKNGVMFVGYFDGARWILNGSLESYWPEDGYITHYRRLPEPPKEGI